MTEKTSHVFPQSIANIPGLHRMLSIKEVREVVPLSTRQIDRLIRQGLFPEPIFISPNRRAWAEPKIRQFLRERELSGQSRRAYSTRYCGPALEAFAAPTISEISSTEEADHVRAI
ncbi:MAG: AlpA family phage regulatory protein [Hyphomicrobium sp.]|uniref:helix-turn-helix transcriptional regulator n=1 Tax=Hyphomicrobium sp. TaxID=82 RepID=UPI0039E3F4AE